MKDRIKFFLADQFEDRPLISLGVVSGIGFVAGLFVAGL